MPRRRKDCPVCGKRNLVKLSNHSADIHQLSAVERKYYLSGAKYLSDPEKPKDMSSQKRIRSDLDDDMSTVARDEESEEEMSSPKRMRNESDDETSTVSNKDIFSSSDDDKSSEETDDASNAGEISEETDDVSNEGESSEETNDSDEEADPWRALIDEATAELHTKHSELVQSFENDGFSEIDTKKQAFAAILPELRKELGNVYMDRLQWMSQLKRDPVHKKKMKTRDAFVADDEFDPDEALVAAVKKRKFLLERMLEDRQHFHDEDDEDEDNACVPYG